MSFFHCGWNYPRIHNEISEASLAAGLWWFTHSLLKHLLTNTSGFGFGSSSIPGGESQRNSPNWQMISCREEVLSSQSPAEHVSQWVVHHLAFKGRDASNRHQSTSNKQSQLCCRLNVACIWAKNLLLNTPQRHSQLTTSMYVLAVVA